MHLFKIGSARLVALTVSLGALVVTAAGSAAAPAAPTRTLWTTGAVSSLAADGARVAVDTGKLPKQCDRVVVWSPLAKSSIHWSAGTNCPGGGSSGGQALLGTALAGTRVAWLESAAGNDQDLTLRTASLVGVKKAQQLAFATNGNGAGGDPEGGYIGNLAGDGSLLAFDTWTFCDDHTGSELPPRPPCTPTTKGVIGQTLWRATATGGKATVKTGALASPLVAVDANRLAVEDDAAAKIRLLGPSGTVLRTIAIRAGTHRGTVLGGTQLAVLTGTTIDVYSTVTGALTTSVPAAGATALTDLQSGIAVYTAGRQVHVVRLSDGRDRIAATAPSALAGAPQLESAGLWYAYNLASGSTRGRVVFVPWAAVLAKLAA